jgi:group I intron endonuclease
MASGIYKIVNKTNGHCYIGSAVNIGVRWSKHKRALCNNKHHSQYLQHAWNKYGADAFDFQVIELCFFLMLIPQEQHYIDMLKPEYNISPTAGSCLGVKHTSEARANMSAGQMGNKKTLGYKHSAETKAKVSAAHTGRKFTPEHKANMAEAKKAWWARRKQKCLNGVQYE